MTKAIVSAAAALFNFADTSDLSDELKSRVEAGAAESPLVGVIVELVNAVDRPVTLVEIFAALTRAKVQGIIVEDIPAETTVRSYVNKAVSTNRIVKPTRQSYAAVGTPVEDDQADDQTTDSTEAEELDPLADL